MELTKRQKEILLKLYNGYKTMSGNNAGSVIIYKGGKSSIFGIKTVNRLLEYNLIELINVGAHSSGYKLTDDGLEFIKIIILNR